MMGEEYGDRSKVTRNPIFEGVKKQFFNGNHTYFFVALASTVVLAMVNLFISYLMQVIIDVVSGTEGGWTLIDVAFAAFVTLVVLILAMLADYYARPLFTKRAMAQYKDLAFRAITKKSIHSFNTENTSTYISAFSNDIASIETNYLGRLFSLVMQGIMFIGALGMMIWYDRVLTLIAFGLTLFPVIASVITGNRMTATEVKGSQENANFLDMVKDILGGFSVIKSFRVEAEIIRNFAQSNRKRLIRTYEFKPWICSLSIEE